VPPGYQMVNGRKVSPELSTESSEVRFLFAFRSHMLYTSPKWDVPVGIRLWEYVSHWLAPFRVKPGNARSFGCERGLFSAFFAQDDKACCGFFAQDDKT
jgi:hypothetical protein